MTSPDEIAELLVHLARAARSEDSDAQLTPAQWTALRYLARANAASRTPSAFASFHATTRGTATQTLKSLEAKGFLRREVSARDARSVCYDLTEAGRQMMAHDPLRDLVAALAALPAPERGMLGTVIGRLVAGVASRREAPQFGTCQDCRHFEATTPDTAFCACMAQSLAAAELGRLCINFTMR